MGIAESIADLLGILSQYVDVTVHNFLDDRRLLRMTYQFQGRRLALPRRLATNLSISYTVSTTEDQVSSVSDGLSSTVATGIVDTLNTAIGDSSLNVTVHGIVNFETPTVTAVSSTD